ncbi:MAG TPA: F0F1 ATP synthase subunit epsilon [Candidatus Acidoferrales bacterium]|nr:F0F1 ATP synthase subunit epsilon [Candidatus Acidoferrales bacterium]
MPETLELEVATPERELVREQVTEVQVPGTTGYFGILPGHAPLVGLLGTGTLTYDVDGQRRYLAVHQGFLEVAADHVRVLANTAEPKAEIDVQRARRALQRSLEEAVNPALGVDPAVALAALARAQARLDTSER